MFNYNQNDAIYSKIMLGFSKHYTLKSDGCYIFSIAKMLGIDPIECNEKMKAVKGFNPTVVNGVNDYCLVDHTKIKLAFPDRIEDVEKVDSFDNEKCLAAISNYGGCIVKVDYDGSNSTLYDTHFCVFIGNKKLFDSLGGIEKPTSTYPILRGLRILKLKPLSVNQNQNDMTQEQQTVINIITEFKNSNPDFKDGNLEGAARGAVGTVAELTTEKAENKRLSKINDGLAVNLGTANDIIHNFTIDMDKAAKELNIDVEGADTLNKKLTLFVSNIKLLSAKILDLENNPGLKFYNYLVGIFSKKNN